MTNLRPGGPFQAPAPVQSRQLDLLLIQSDPKVKATPCRDPTGVETRKLDKGRKEGRTAQGRPLGALVPPYRRGSTCSSKINDIRRFLLCLQSFPAESVVYR